MTFDDDIDFTNEWHERRIKRCRSCKAKVIWFVVAGRNVPADADSVEPGDTSFDPAKHEHHHENCRGHRQAGR